MLEILSPETVKIIRDPVHGYISLSQLEITLIDTPEFQRLRDIRQLTCQHVYPSARHTRFEHSLGVFELTKQAIRRLIENGFLVKNADEREDIPKSDERTYLFRPKEILSTQLAALLHDIGHCPFSHMGESEISRSEAQKRLLMAADESGIKRLSKNDKTFYETLSKSFECNKGGSTHELLSCIIVLKRYRDRIDKVLEEHNESNPNNKAYVDYEMLIRCILGIKYTITRNDYNEQEAETILETQRKNLLISLINSDILDMDKLDYIMRDAFFTGINVPEIDTKRLFRNMYVSSKYELIFTSRAVPSLLNLIEARDNLYLWVYNHHVAVYSEFLYRYIFRRLAHNARDEAKEHSKTEESVAVGDVPQSRLFSVDAIMNDGVSDSDLIHMLTWQYREYEKHLRTSKEFGSTQESDLRRRRALELISCLQKRDFLKSWWKTLFEYNAYLNEKFSKDSKTRHELGERICYSKNEDFDSTEFRSQLAKHVRYLVNDGKTGDDEILRDGEFFIVQRSNKFYGKDDIEQLVIYLKHNEILGGLHSEKAKNTSNDKNGDYFSQPLTELMPRKKYDEMYEKGGFFLYVRQYNESLLERGMSKKEYYDLIDSAFVTVASEFTANIEREEFMARYCLNDNEKKKANEQNSKDRLLAKFRKSRKEDRGGEKHHENYGC